jgi:hypothetical protein
MGDIPEVRKIVSALILKAHGRVEDFGTYVSITLFVVI